jgi:hypothetical protein
MKGAHMNGAHMNGAHMNPLQKLHHDGQRIWLDNITRDLLTCGTLQSYIDELGITGLNLEPDDLRPGVLEHGGVRCRDQGRRRPWLLR